MFLPFRGARATGRAGAFTAGVDDASALYYNPAGMADIDGWSFLIDGVARAAARRLRSRRLGRQSAAARRRLDERAAAADDRAHLQAAQIKGAWLTLGFGVWVPYLGINSWPENGPQRYSNISINGSLLGVVELAASFRIKDWFWLGVGLQNMILHFHSRLMLSAPARSSTARPKIPASTRSRRSTATRRSRRRASSAPSSRSPKFRAGINAAAAVLRALVGHGGARACRPIRSSPTPRCTATHQRRLQPAADGARSASSTACRRGCASSSTSTTRRGRCSRIS